MRGIASPWGQAGRGGAEVLSGSTVVVNGGYGLWNYGSKLEFVQEKKFVAPLVRFLCNFSAQSF